MTAKTFDECDNELSALNLRLENLKLEKDAAQKEYDRELKRMVLEALTSVSWKMHRLDSIETDVLPLYTLLGSIVHRVGKRTFIHQHDQISIRIGCCDGNIITANNEEELVRFIRTHKLQVDTTYAKDYADGLEERAEEIMQRVKQIEGSKDQ